MQKLAPYCYNVKHGANKLILFYINDMFDYLLSVHAEGVV